MDVFGSLGMYAPEGMAPGLWPMAITFLGGWFVALIATRRAWGQAAGAFLTLLFLAVAGGALVETLQHTSSWSLDRWALVFDGAVLFFSGFSCVLLCHSENGRPPATGLTFALVLWGTAAAMGVNHAKHLMVFFLALQCLFLCSLGLLCTSMPRALSAEAMVKHFVPWAGASAMFALGLAFVFGATGGVLDHQGMGQFLSQHGAQPLLVIGILLLLIPFFLWLGLAPLHGWRVDINDAAPAATMPWLSAAPSLVLWLALGRFLIEACPLHALAPNGSGLVPVIMGVSLLSAVLGNVGALKQKRLSRWVAHMTLGQWAMVLLLFSVPAGAGDAGSLALGFVMAVALAGFAINALFVSCSMGDASLATFGDCEGLAQNNPRVALAAVLFTAALLGLPPVGAFAYRVGALRAFVGFETLWPVLFVIVGSYGLGAFAGIRLLAKMWSGPARPAHRLYPASAFGLTLLFAIVVLTTWATTLVPGL